MVPEGLFLFFLVCLQLLRSNETISTLNIQLSYNDRGKCECMHYNSLKKTYSIIK